MSKDAFDLIIQGAGGSQRKLAAALGIKPQSITKWRRRVPAERVLEVESISKVPRTVIRPDIYPPSDYAA
jgi:DNA-binding transcriptional regulator YdaS (Cro superfamily)